ncbi:hypothetical protein PIB30_077793 [Stylosanthes scabra]|uniref:Uncharacterized protein n=1 Tax=Stylosanthes scabra TaxID=79078 RepID=A0ABU6URU1_9FABA|nr:hypothetical protein [Stylosanthes scabra]
MASSQPNIHFNFPQFPPPPPFHPFNYPPPPPPPSHPFAPPPPHVYPPPTPHHPVHPPPYPVPTPPSPDNHHPTIIVIVFVSFGCLMFLAVLAFALCCMIKKWKKKQETDIIHFDEHRHVTEAIVPGPFGEQVVVISVEDDVHIDEEIIKNEEFGHALHAKQSSNANEVNDPRSFDHNHQQKLENKN